MIQKYLHNFTLSGTLIFSLLVSGCSQNSGGSVGTAYSITSAVSVKLKSSTVASVFSSKTESLIGANSVSNKRWNAQTAYDTTMPNSCKDNFCITPTALTGKYYGAGLMIQSSGNGMNAYFGQDSWSGVVGTSTTKDFNFTTPLTQTGDLHCCAGTGDLTQPNSYFSDAIYMFGYLDATFSLTTEADGVQGTAVGTHTIRFILADDVITSAKRGDLMVKDADTTFKWMDDDAGGTLSTTRPTSPVVLNTKLVTYVNPFGTDKGNQVIPVIGSLINDTAAGGKNLVTQTQLQTAGRTYTFDFSGKGFIFFPTTLRTDVGMISSRKELLKRIYLQGLPHSTYETGGSAGTTTLTITEPTPTASASATF